MKEIKWPHVALVSIVLMVMGFLAYMDKETEAILGAVLAILTAMGFGFVINKQNEIHSQNASIQESATTIKENTNGRITELTTMLQTQSAAHMAAMEKMQREQNAVADQHRRDMKEMAQRLATMMPPAVDLNPGGEIHSPDV